MKVEDALDLMLDGASREVIQRLSKSQSNDMDELSTRVISGCAYAILNHEAEARYLLTPSLPPEASKTLRAVRFAGLGFLASRAKDIPQYRHLMNKSIDEDTSLALPKFSLALYYQWNETDFTKAEELLQEVKILSPNSHLVDVYLVGLTANAGDPSRAFALLTEIPREEFGGLRRSLLGAVLRLGSMPFSGGFVALLLSGLTFVPYLGPLVLSVWLAFSVGSLVRLRRISTKTAALPAALSITLLAAYVIRSFLLGRIFP